ncbi:putative developmental regulator protein [Phaeoacremonium minimum UCRPA7]|uniref:Putative developmental regulator protein n=1 Tax=Phaeoacremonium minimum (strain UCR-PA7) TaxID=1286976 RepID=R8BME8_PHAM7|nr:putative developmental regulator protein [Phaeoacremonium minimum UCRPA7]EOO00539.1 putative developmental regulator protein [Phaeoacremonium minimum UCRPA7]
MATPSSATAPYGDHFARNDHFTHGDHFARSDHFAHTQTQDQQPSPTTAAPVEAQSPASRQRMEKALIPFTSEFEGRRYTLDVVQQPKRARMCGFGDKDRRPITPPPCVRLIVTDISTGKEVDCNEIEHTMYVLNVDLWSEDAQKEVNLVRHTTATPSISSTTPESFAAVEARPQFQPLLPGTRDPNYPQLGYSQAPNPYMQAGYGQASYLPSPNGYGPPTQYYPGADMYGGVLPSQSRGIGGYGPPHVYDPHDLPMAQRLAMQGTQPSGMFTRNLIGSLAASAFRLTDPLEKIGIWFILQDLSVRTEGNFRLRFSFVNVGRPSTNPNGQPANQNSIVNTGQAPVLASCFSDVFQVFSAKKFPGVCESTGLSKCFASQGIKIPIRKEGATSKGGDDDDDY